MSVNYRDELRRFVRALPEHFKQADEDYAAFIKGWANENPGYFLTPIKTTEAAELLGITPNALRQRRSRRQGTPGYIAQSDNHGYYQNRLVILLDIARQTRELEVMARTSIKHAQNATNL